MKRFISKDLAAINFGILLYLTPVCMCIVGSCHFYLCCLLLVWLLSNHFLTSSTHHSSVHAAYTNVVHRIHVHVCIHVQVCV